MVCTCTIELAIFYLLYFLGGKPSGQEITDRKSKIINLLQASFIQQHGSEVNRDILLSSIGLDIVVALQIHWLLIQSNKFSQTLHSEGTEKMTCILFELYGISNLDYKSV
jgi:hypothetical protein